jgi:hypothetical protein
MKSFDADMPFDNSENVERDEDSTCSLDQTALSSHHVNPFINNPASDESWWFDLDQDTALNPLFGQADGVVYGISFINPYRTPQLTLFAGSQNQPYCPLNNVAPAQGKVIIYSGCVLLVLATGF